MIGVDSSIVGDDGSSWCTWCSYNCPPGGSEPTEAKHGLDWFVSYVLHFVFDAYCLEARWFAYGLLVRPMYLLLWAIWWRVREWLSGVGSRMSARVHDWWCNSPVARWLRFVGRKIRGPQAAGDLIGAWYRRRGYQTGEHRDMVWSDCPGWAIGPRDDRADGVTWRVVAMGDGRHRRVFRTPSQDMVFEEEDGRPDLSPQRSIALSSDDVVCQPDSDVPQDADASCDACGSTGAAEL